MEEFKNLDVTGGSDDSGFGTTDDEMIRIMRGLVKLSIEKSKLFGVPVVRYDQDLGKAYLEYSDGRREYAT